VADRVNAALRLSRRRALLLAGLAAMSPVLARSADPTSNPVRGPRRTIGLRPFDVTPSFTSISTADAAAHIEAALIAQLEKTGCCTVVARDELAPLLVTMEAGKPLPEDAAPPAQFIIAGSATIYSPPGFGGGISESGPRRDYDSVEFEVRLSDALTAMVLGVFVAECRLDKFGGRRGVAGGADTADAFVASPIGQATNVALADIVAQLSGALAALPPTGRASPTMRRGAPGS
jgi:curli biogenesis system outer membrane secretion channel CsgG